GPAARDAHAIVAASVQFIDVNASRLVFQTIRTWRVSEDEVIQQFSEIAREDLKRIFAAIAAKRITILGINAAPPARPLWVPDVVGQGLVENQVTDRSEIDFTVQASSEVGIQRIRLEVLSNDGKRIYKEEIQNPPSAQMTRESSGTLVYKFDRVPLALG